MKQEKMKEKQVSRRGFLAGAAAVTAGAAAIGFPAIVKAQGAIN